MLSFGQLSVFIFGKAYRVVLAQCGRLTDCEAHVLISLIVIIWISLAGYVGFVSRCIPSSELSHSVGSRCHSRAQLIGGPWQLLQAVRSNDRGNYVHHSACALPLISGEVPAYSNFLPVALKLAKPPRIYAHGVPAGIYPTQGSGTMAGQLMQILHLSGLERHLSPSTESVGQLLLCGTGDPHTAAGP